MSFYPMFLTILIRPTMIFVNLVIVFLSQLATGIVISKS